MQDDGHQADLAKVIADEFACSKAVLKTIGSETIEGAIINDIKQAFDMCKRELGFELKDSIKSAIDATDFTNADSKIEAAGAFSKAVSMLLDFVYGFLDGFTLPPTKAARFAKVDAMLEHMRMLVYMQC